MGGLRAAVTWVVFALCATRAFAQSPTTGAIQGVILDAKTGDSLPGVTVVATSPGTAAQTALTDGDGSYKINELAPGDYTVTFYYLDITFVRKAVRVGVQKVTPVFQRLAFACPTTLQSAHADHADQPIIKLNPVQRVFRPAGTLTERVWWFAVRNLEVAAENGMIGGKGSDLCRWQGIDQPASLSC